MNSINTNVQSIVAQNTLARTDRALANVFYQLSTGQRINRGADDPAGLIASENLSKQLAALDAESRSIERNTAVVDTADAVLSDVSGRLAEAKGLAVQAANTGAMSDAERDALRLQYDSITQSVDRSIQTASFGGRALFDGTVAVTSGDALRGGGAEGRMTLPRLTPRGIGDLGGGGSGLSLADTAPGGAADPFSGKTRGAGVAVLDAAIDRVSGLRGELGAFSRNALGSAAASVSAAIANTAGARSEIRDLDYYRGVADRTRQSILARAGTAGLATAMASAEKSLELLGG